MKKWHHVVIWAGGVWTLIGSLQNDSMPGVWAASGWLMCCWLVTGLSGLEWLSKKMDEIERKVSR